MADLEGLKKYRGTDHSQSRGGGRPERKGRRQKDHLSASCERVRDPKTQLHHGRYQ